MTFIDLKVTELAHKNVSAILDILPLERLLKSYFNCNSLKTEPLLMEFEFE